MQTFLVFTGAAPGGSSTSAIHGSRLTWKVLTGTGYFLPIHKIEQPEPDKMPLKLKYTR